MLAFRCIQKLLLVVVIFFWCAVNARTVKMDYLRLLLSLRFWFVDPRWSRAEFVLSSSLLMSDPKPKLSYIIQRVFVFSPKHFTIVLYLGLLHHSRSLAVQRRVYDSVLYLFSPDCWLKVTFMGHPDKAIIPAAHTRPVFSTDFLFHLYSFFSKTQTAFCDPQLRSRLWDRKKCLEHGSLASLGSFVRVLSPTLNQMYR